MTLFVLDLDRFKQVNDTLGHANGDSLLKQIAARLKVASRDGDVLARLGRDEFAIVLGDVESRNEARLVAERLASSLDAPIVVGGLSIRVEASIGIAIAPEHGRKLSQLTHAADVASALPHDLYKLVSGWRMRTERLELEITESTIMSVPARAERVLQTLHDMGFSLTIDDYGSRPVPADQLTAWLSALEALPRPARSRTSATPRAGARVSG